MATISFVWGLLSLAGLMVAFFPCLGSLNWLNIPFAGVGLIISLIAVNTASSQDRGKATTGVALCSIAIVFGIIRLIAGGGIV
ncbi:MAG: hypothetical protein IPN18_04735 [Ignavibacteriales bacterium]|jgi:hypothetical protein|nr:hypothetical protein [Ignavibacteriales bacterium]MBK8661133.1 hypothetical protein [Ignavibacteriales bacterium]MBP7542299.1 hypothetical protein [Ignavibacteriaceae bacterium]MCC6636624.1 hypothetical protein [Ignavibacteriaceae bacterium]